MEDRKRGMETTQWGMLTVEFLIRPRLLLGLMHFQTCGDSARYGLLGVCHVRVACTYMIVVHSITALKSQKQVKDTL